MSYKVPSELANGRPLEKEPWAHRMSQLQQALKDLEYAAITNNSSRLESSTILITSLIQSGLEETKSSDLVLHGSLELVYRLKLKIPIAIETLVHVSEELSKGNLEGEVQELEIEKLLTFTPQILSLVRDFASAVDESKLLPVKSTATSNSPLTFLHDHSLRDIGYNPDGELVGASLAVLIEEMTPYDRFVNLEFSSTFFMTFRLFSSPMELLESLITRWNLSSPSDLPPNQIKSWQEQKLNSIRFRVLNVIWQWVTRHWEPETDDDVLPMLHEFLSQCEASFRSIGVSRFFQHLIEYLTNLKAKESTLVAPTVAIQKSIRPELGTPLHSDAVRPRRGTIRRFSMSLLKRDPPSPKISITDIEPIDIAHQLTLIEVKLFQSLKPKEILKMARGHHTENVLAVLSLSADITDWVSESIFNESSSKKRTASIKLFIKIAHSCLKLQNFASAHSILKALNSPALVPSLDSISSELPYRQRSQLSSLNEWDSSENNSQNDQQLQRRLHEVVPPAVPILALYASDIVSTLNLSSHLKLPGNPSKDIVNFGKYRKIAEITQDITIFQAPYNWIESAPDIQDYLYSTFKRTCLLGENGLSDQRRRSVISTTSLKRSHSLGSIPVDSYSTMQNPAIMTQNFNPSVSDIATIYSIPSSRTASTNYGLFYTRHAPSQDTFAGQQWWADQEALDAESKPSLDYQA